MRAPISPPPGFLSIVRTNGRPVHVNCQKISCYGTGVSLQVHSTWIAVSGRKKLIWTDETMEEIAGKISSAIAG